MILFAVLIPTGNALGQTAEQSWLIVVSSQSTVSNLTQKQVMGLFLGRSKFLPDGDRVYALDHPVESATRANFYRALTGKNIADIDAYWARLKYSGRATPPLPVDSHEQIIRLLTSRAGTIAYLPISYTEELAKNGLIPVLTMQ